MRLYQPRISLKSKNFYIASLYIAPICVTAAYITPSYLGINTTVIGNIWISYVSPYCIGFSIFAIVLFSKIELQSRLINWIAASSFAVYLIHTNPNTFYYYKDFFVRLHDSSDDILYWLYTFGVLILIFIVAVMIDQIRIVLWTLLWNKFKKRTMINNR